MKNNWYTIKKLSKDFWGILESGHFEKVISYLLVGREQAILIDTGMGIHSINEVVKNITVLPVYVINTHCHFDHVGGNHEFQSIAIFPTKQSMEISKTGWDKEELDKLTSPDDFYQEVSGFNIDTYSIKPFTIERFLIDQQNLIIDKFNFKIFHTPGHSPDSVCILEQNNNYLFAGDTVYNGPIYLQMQDSNVRKYLASLKKLEMISPKPKIFGGHNEFRFDNDNIIKIMEIIEKNNSKNVQVVGNISVLR